jgi:uncharacterized integral membrane protein
MSARKLLGKSRTFGSRALVYQGLDALEIEVNEQYDVVEKRVLFEDVLMVTIHREKGMVYLVLTGMMAAFFLGIGILIVSVSVDAWPAAIVFGVFGFPFLLAFLTRLMLGVDIVTVFGRRSKADLRFALRKQRAREVYGTICAAVRNGQRRAGETDRSPDVSSPLT